MCGIFGVLNNPKLDLSNNLSVLLENLFYLSESRGHDASGIAISDNEKIAVLKRSIPASRLVNTSVYRELLKNSKNFLGLIGHARMETNGSFNFSYNNQPVVKDGCVTIHNGIVVNDHDLWSRFSDIRQEFQVDTEVVNSLIRKFIQEGNSLIEAYRKSLNLFEGAYSLATLLDDQDYLLLSTNTGSLFLVKDKDGKVLFFASEKYFVEQVITNVYPDLADINVEQLKAGEGVAISLQTNEVVPFDINSQTLVNIKKLPTNKKIEVLEDTSKDLQPNILVKVNNETDIGKAEKLVADYYEENLPLINNLKRCTRCILPETMPFIEFDEEGVCNYCRNYQPMTVKGNSELCLSIDSYRSKDGSPDCIVAFSGGRDSSYGLHYIKKELGMHPVAYSYDWGMLTDLGRRNQARMTGSLGVEHILISADIQRKRHNIKQNVEAWLKKPDLGTVPLFMAGDKQYFYYANMLKKQMNINLVILCENLLEKTDFKSGFCGIAPKVNSDKNKKFYSLSLQNTFKMMFYYGKQYLQNTAYINSSLLDSIWAFQSYYFIPHEYLSLYTYIKWEEKTVESVLKEYNWEISPDTPTTWRIGDGTASFYNYIYYTMAGFSENDTFRSNQVREGALTREDALRIANADNKPRFNSMRWYCDTINVNLLDAVKIINNSPKLYK